MTQGIVKASVQDWPVNNHFLHADKSLEPLNATSFLRLQT